MTNVLPPALAELLAEAEAKGLRLRVSARGSLAVAGQPDPVLLARLRANKLALVAVLRAAPTPGAAP
jgi:hypothetical protein